jgi:hypothetical protein
MHIPRYIAALVITSLVLSGCTLARVANALAQSKSAFAPCTSDSRIMCELGSETLATRIAPLLPQAIAVVEKAQFSTFASPIIIYTYASRESFASHSGALAYADGAVSLGRLNLSPKLLSTPERTRGILTHELSHLNLQLQMGSIAWARVPSWFHEGLATLVSDGGGAETVTSEDATVALSQGKQFEPEGSQWLLFPKSASAYGLGPHMYYRQASLFVGFMRDSDPIAFEKMLRAIEAKIAFSQAIESSYRENLASIWMRFLSRTSPLVPADGLRQSLNAIKEE